MSNEEISPRVSVIIPAYNHERFIDEAIESVLSQTCSDLELIVIDDGSADGTGERVKRFDDPRMRRFSQKNKGTPRTINRGIKLARGEFIAILDSDDVYHPERLERFVAMMDEKPDCMCAASRVRPVDDEGRRLTAASAHGSWVAWYEEAIVHVRKDSDFLVSLLRYNFVVSTSNIFVRSRVFAEQKAFNELLAYCHDYEFLIRIVSRYPFVFLEEELLDYRLHAQNTIRENEFLKHLEVLYTLFHVVNVKEILARRFPNDRIAAPLFQELYNNPEINPHRFAVEYMEIINEKSRIIETLNQQLRERNAALDERDRRLAEADRWLRDLQKQAEERERRFAEADRLLRDWEERVRGLTREVEEKTFILEGIYNSRSWLWLTRYRSFRLWLASTRDLWRGRLRKALRIAMQPIKSVRREGCPDRQPEDNAVDPLHVEIIHPLEKDRPVVVHALANFMMGGSSRLVADLVEHLGHRYDHRVVTSYAPTPPAFTGFPVHVFPRSADAIMAFLRDSQARMLHIHYWGDCDEPWYREVFAAARRHPCFVIENINTPVETHIDAVVDRYVYVSDYARHFTSRIPLSSRVIYPGSNLDMFQREGAPVPDDTIGMVYRLERDKLDADAIRVFIDVVTKRPGTRAIIVGGGSFLDAYRRQVEREGLSDSFEFPGYVDYRELPDYYRRFSLFVAPVWKESFGQVSPFAMGMEIPVVGYNVGALPEILNGSECLGDNRDELVRIIIDLLNDREKRLAIGRRNRARARELFSIEAMIDRYAQLYGEVLDQ